MRAPGGEATLQLPANGHVARFIEELFPDADTSEFEGTLTVTAKKGTIAGTAIQVGSKPGEFTTLPVTPLFTSAGLKILVDASRDGGVWWSPQAGPFDPDAPHQGKKLADYLRRLRHAVTELPRPTTIPSQLLAPFNIVIRFGSLGEEYTQPEILAYHDYLETGGKLFLLSGRHRPGKQDSLALSFGILFQGTTRGEREIDRFEPHPITEGLPLPYGFFGSGITELPDAAEILAYLSMGTYLDLNDNSQQDLGEPTGAAALGRMTFGDGELVFIGSVDLGDRSRVDNIINWLKLR